MQSKSRVFIPQSVDHKKINILPASEFGDIVICWDGNQLMHDTFSCIRKIKKSMRNATKNDYLLCIGDPAVIALSAVILSEITGGNYRILKWDRQTKTYYSIVISMDDEDESVSVE